MSPSSDPAEFRAKATAVYAKVGRWLVALVIGTGSLGFLIGAAIGLAIRSHEKFPLAPEGPGWFVAGLIGLAAGGTFAFIVAVIIWCVVGLFYVMSQDGA